MAKQREGRDLPDITGGPAERDGKEAQSSVPSPFDVALCDARKSRHDPDNVEGQSIESEPGEGSRDSVRHEEDGQCAEEFTKVGTTDDDLRPSGSSEDTTSISWCEGGLEESMEVESDRVRGEEPDEGSVAKDDLATDIDGLAETKGSLPDGLQVALFALVLFNCRESSVAIGVSVDWLLETKGGDPNPSCASQSHENWRHEVTIIVTLHSLETRIGSDIVVSQVRSEEKSISRSDLRIWRWRTRKRRLLMYRQLRRRCGSRRPCDEVG